MSIKNAPITATTDEMAANAIKKDKTKWWFKKPSKQVDARNQIYKIVLTGILLGLAVGLSLIEIRIPIMGASVPIRIFDITIMVFAIPIIGLWYSALIGMIEPWLHFLLDSDHPPIQMFFDNCANLALVLSFYLIFYQLLRVNHVKADRPKQKIMKHIMAGGILIPFNALIASLTFAMTLVVLANTNFEKPTEYVNNITLFYQQWAPIFFILLAIELGRFLVTYGLFSLIEKRLGRISRI